MLHATKRASAWLQGLEPEDKESGLPVCVLELVGLCGLRPSLDRFGVGRGRRLFCDIKSRLDLRGASDAGAVQLDRCTVSHGTDANKV